MTIRQRPEDAIMLKSATLMSICSLICISQPAAAQVPDAIAAKGETAVLTLHADGAQVYDCKADAGGKLTWQFREPIATLMLDGKTVGRHYAGPNWEHADGSRVLGKPIGRAPGATANDIPWLKLEVAEAKGAGALSSVTAIQRINTVGGQFEGSCDKAGATIAVPYAADYVFLKKSS
jgi:hypothetical protein